MPQELTEIESPGDGMGGGQLQSDVFENPKHLRQDARLVTRLLGLGCIPPAKIATLLNKAAHMMEEAADGIDVINPKDGSIVKHKDPKAVAGILRAFVLAAKVELDTRKYANPIAKHYEHHVTVDSGEPGTVAERAALLNADVYAELVKRGLVIECQPIGPIVGSNGAAGGASGGTADGNGDATAVP